MAPIGNGIQPSIQKSHTNFNSQLTMWNNLSWFTTTSYILFMLKTNAENTQYSWLETVFLKFPELT